MTAQSIDLVDEIPSLVEVRDKLFKRLPPKLKPLLSAEEIDLLAGDALNTLRYFLNSKSAYHMSYVEFGGHLQGLFVVLKDRPFIVGSINLVARRMNIDVEGILHPIFSVKGEKYSLSFTVFNRLSAEKGKEFEERISNVLRDVIVCTEDFPRMTVKAEMILRRTLIESSDSILSERQEATRFVRWLLDGNFTFLGYTECIVAGEGGGPFLGIFRIEDQVECDILRKAQEMALTNTEGTRFLSMFRLPDKSPVYSDALLIVITFPKRSCDGVVVSIDIFVGLLSSKGLYYPTSEVPVIREKLDQFLNDQEIDYNSHDYKYVVNAFNGIPKVEAFRLPQTALKDLLNLSWSLENCDGSSVFLYHDTKARALFCALHTIEDRFKGELVDQVTEYIESEIRETRGLTESATFISPRGDAYVFFNIPILSESPSLNFESLKAKIISFTLSWSDHLKDLMWHSFEPAKARVIGKKYECFFNKGYQAIYSPDEAMDDITNLERLPRQSNVAASISKKASGEYVVSIYKESEAVSLPLSLSVLNNIGLCAYRSEEVKLTAKAGNVFFVNRFFVKTRFDIDLSKHIDNPSLNKTLEGIFSGSIEDDLLNSLVLSTDLPAAGILLIRAISAFMWQLTRFSSLNVIYETFSKTPQAASVLWRIFDARFNPGLEVDRGSLVCSLSEDFKEILKGVGSISEDRILRRFLDIIHNIVRTNFYMGNSKTVAFKVHSESLSGIKEPKPLYEIFVYSSEFEGVHLRSAPISRGGIRWSDRTQDYRDEILGLMKTQRVKNAIIVADGAKGGFVVRKPSEDRAILKDEAEKAYKGFIRALLSVTDNLTAGKIYRSESLIIYDQDDPYLVVAADKGTANYSDYANEIAQNEFNYWLNDAFASGGSSGYGHKELGITARGVWECVKKHFGDLNINPRTDQFTMVGIGDMSGDVFGNGLLQSRNAKLLAAFNHKHIFLDPNPDPNIAFEERLRLFKLPVSQWTGYNRKLISEGGGIFDRESKEIGITREVRKVLGLSESVPDVVDGESLIQLILKSPVDLLWNGGIGTYVKASTETHAEIFDSSNDNVRVDANELRVRVVGEGGNLGFTQMARVEYALNGGKINTDAVDNSAGVDLSDHEVNLKILLAQAVDERCLTTDGRNLIMSEVENSIVEGVLAHNRSQALMLSIAEERSRKSIEMFQHVIKHLCRKGYLDIKRDRLPDEEEILARAKDQKGLTRPELATCFAATRMWLREELVASSWLEEDMLDEYLFSYFPKQLHKDFSSDIKNHPLSKNIKALQITEEILSLFGMVFVNRIQESTGVSIPDIAKCCLAASHLLKANHLQSEFWSLDLTLGFREFLNLRSEFGTAARTVAACFLFYHGNEQYVNLLDLYRGQHEELLNEFPDIVTKQERTILEERKTKFVSMGFSGFATVILSTLPWQREIFQMLWTGRQAGVLAVEGARVFREVLDLLNLRNLANVKLMIEPRDRWEEELKHRSFEDIWQYVALLASKVACHQRTSSSDVSSILRSVVGIETVSTLIREAFDKPPSLAKVSVIASRISDLARNISL